MPYPIYAVESDLLNYLGLQLSEELPADFGRLLKRASELIQYATQGNVIITLEDHLDALKQATCAQVEYWIEATENAAISGNDVDSFSLGDLSMNFGKGSSSASSTQRQLAPRARIYLLSEGLLYRGINSISSGVI